MDESTGGLMGSVRGAILNEDFIEKEMVRYTVSYRDKKMIAEYDNSRVIHMGESALSRRAPSVEEKRNEIDLCIN